MRGAIVLLIGLLAATGCGGSSATPTGSPRPTQTTAAGTAAGGTLVPGDLATVEGLCGLLNAADFGQFGFVTAAQPSTNSDGPGTAYCVYAGESGATGGIEFDAFLDDTVADAEATFETAVDEAGPMADATPITLPGADRAVIDTDIEGTWSSVVVRAGRLTFTISLPTSDAAEAQLTALAALVLARTAGAID
jgi:hypothetical protein